MKCSVHRECNVPTNRRTPETFNSRSRRFVDRAGVMHRPYEFVDRANVMHRPYEFVDRASEMHRPYEGLSRSMYKYIKYK
jgi:hypothetical protein